MCLWPNPVTNKQLLFIIIKLVVVVIIKLGAFFPELWHILCNKFYKNVPFFVRNFLAGLNTNDSHRLILWQRDCQHRLPSELLRRHW